MKAIFYSARSLSGREGKSVIRHIGIISKTCSTIDHLSNTWTDAVKLEIEDTGCVKINQSINLFGRFYESDAVNMASWLNIYDALNVEPLKAYDRLFLIGGMDLWRSGLTRFGKRAGVFPSDAGQVKFQSVGVHCINILAMLKAHNLYSIPLQEIAFDPNELSCDLFHEQVAPKHDYTLYHGYDIPKYNIKRLDSLQHYFSERPKGLFELDKTEDFTFGYTILEKSNREEFVPAIREMISKFNTANVYVKDYQTGTDTLIDPDAYLCKLEISRFTYMLPSYDRHCFSGYRFIEAIQNDCLPLIHPNCNRQDIELSYGIDLSPLVVTTPPSESQRLELLEYVKSKIMVVEKLFR